MFISIIRIRIIIALIITSVLLTGCEIENTGKRVWVYETNQYQVYKQMKLLIANSDGANATLVIEGTDGHSESWILEIEDIKVKVQTGENCMVECTILIDEKEVHSFQINGGSDMVGLKVEYVDITKDGSRDVVIIGEPPHGTRAGSYWLFAYDKKNDCNIEVFEDGNKLTDLQMSQLDECCDEEFFKLFPNYVGADLATGEHFVDEFGNLYYEIAIWDESGKNMGNMIIFFTYDKKEKRFDVADMIYMPRYVCEYN